MALGKQKSVTSSIRSEFCLPPSAEVMATGILRHRKLIGEAVRHYRLRARLTQEKLAEKADLNPQISG